MGIFDLAETEFIIDYTIFKNHHEEISDGLFFILMLDFSHTLVHLQAVCIHQMAALSDYRS